MRHGYNPGAGSLCHSPSLGTEKDTADDYFTSTGGHKALRDLRHSKHLCFSYKVGYFLEEILSLVQE